MNSRLRRALVLVLLSPAALIVSVLGWTGLAHLRYVLYRRAHDDDRGFALRGWPLARYYAETCVSALRIAGWFLRAGAADGLRPPAGRRDGPPVLLVHGFHLAGATFWGLRTALARRGRPTMAVFLGLPYRDPAVYERALGRRLRTLLAAFPGEQVDVVAHSMGGVVLRAVLAAEPDLADKVRRIVTLGSPHAGTALLRWWRTGPVFRMMARDAPYLRRLPTFAESAPHARVTTVATRDDLVVYPWDTAHLRGAEAVTVEGISHLALLTDPGVRRLVLARLGP